MGADKYSRSVSMRCSTCGSKDFEFDAEVQDGPIRCSACDRVFTREELIRENGALIDEHVDEVKNEIVDDLRASFRKAFAGSKYIKLK